MKVLKHKNILGLLYGLLLLIPFASVLVRTAYVSMNKNAFKSYDYNNQLVLANDIQSGYTYVFSKSVNLSSYLNTSVIEVEDLTISSNDNTIYTTINPYFSSIKYLRFSNYTLNLYDDSLNVLDALSLASAKSFYITFKSLTNSNITTSYNMLFVLQSDYLSNAFEYSLKEITNNDIGNVNFFTWFADMFLDVNDGTSAIYIGFINWYFNYALLMSLGYVLFGVLMWFINWVRRMIERGQDFGQGGF